MPAETGRGSAVTALASSSATQPKKVRFCLPEQQPGSASPGYVRVDDGWPVLLPTTGDRRNRWKNRRKNRTTARTKTHQQVRRRALHLRQSHSRLLDARPSQSTHGSSWQRCRNRNTTTHSLRCLPTAAVPCQTASRRCRRPHDFRRPTPIGLRYRLLGATTGVDTLPAKVWGTEPVADKTSAQPLVAFALSP